MLGTLLNKDKNDNDQNKAKHRALLESIKGKTKAGFRQEESCI